MPCQDDRYFSRGGDDCSSERRQIKSLKTGISTLTRMLCSSCNLLKKHKIFVPGDTIKWWENHQKVDAARIKKEKKVRAAHAKKRRDQETKEKQKRAALKKLSLKERKVLGLEK